MTKVRVSNDYRLVYKPEHPKAMKGEDWGGYVYEHIVVAESMLGRFLRPEEVVHHLDLDRSNNREGNLLVLERSQHIKIHIWLDKGAPMVKAIGEQKFLKNRVNSGESKVVNKVCIICNLTLQKKQINYCSVECKQVGNAQKSKKPPKHTLEKLIAKKTSLLQIGKLYGVSDNAVRKWLISYDLLIPKRKKTTMAILSQAESTLSEGAETTGEVQSS